MKKVLVGAVLSMTVMAVATSALALTTINGSIENQGLLTQKDGKMVKNGGVYGTFPRAINPKTSGTFNVNFYETGSADFTYYRLKGKQFQTCKFTFSYDGKTPTVTASTTEGWSDNGGICSVVSNTALVIS